MSNEDPFNSKATPEEMLSDDQRIKLKRTDIHMPAQDSGLHTKVSEKKQLAYLPEFKDQIKEYPHAIKIFLDAIETMNTNKAEPDSEEAVIENNGVRVELILRLESPIYKVRVGDVEYFVKSDSMRGPGIHPYNEVLDSEEARHKLLKAQMEGVRVIDYQLGFQNGSERFYVAKWFDGKLLNYFTDRLKSPLFRTIENDRRPKTDDEIKTDRELLRSLEKKVAEIRDLFPNYSDLLDYNMFYDEDNGDIVLFDLRWYGQAES